MYKIFLVFSGELQQIPLQVSLRTGDQTTSKEPARM